MKKTICFTLVMLTIISCLTACSFNTYVSGALKNKAESTPKVNEMMTALSEGRMSDAKALMHPQASEKATDDTVEQMISYFNGRSATSTEMVNVNVSSSTGTSGKARQEQASYKVTLNDGAVVHISAVYLSNSAGNGFISFQLVLGVI